MTWPNDRKFVGPDGTILNPWMGQLEKLKPLLEWTAQDFITLLAMIRAAQEADEDGDAGTAINLALPIDNEPLEDEDWFITYKNSANAGRRVPMSLINSGGGARELISSTNLTGLATVDITVPAGFTDILVSSTLTLSGAGFGQIAYSIDSGSSFLNQTYGVFNSAGTRTGNLTTPGDMHTTAAGTDVVYYRSIIYDYAGSATTKNVVESGLNQVTTAGFAGSRRIFSASSPINLIRLTASAGTFDGGTCELWGIP